MASYRPTLVGETGALDLRLQPMRRLQVLCAGVVVLLAACSGPAPGSQEDLAKQIDELELPASFVELGDNYQADCPAVCPVYVRWFDSIEAAETTRTQLFRSFEEAGITLEENSVRPGVLTARGDAYIFFVVTDTEMLAGNQFAPSGTDVEISARALEELTPSDAEVQRRGGPYVPGV